MHLKEYQERANSTCKVESANFSYMFLNLVGEVGEFASKVAKDIRYGRTKIIDNDYHSDWKRFPTTEEWKERAEELKKEAGDILWQLAGLCTYMGWQLEDIAQMNLDKLKSRQERNVIDGDGDNR